MSFRTNRWVDWKTVPRLAVVLACFGAAGQALAQTSPGTASSGDPFEVYGSLYSGSAPAGALAGDAWAQGELFRGVLDVNGNPALNAQGIAYRASRQVDGNWGTASSIFDMSVFAGGNKNSDLIGAADGPWGWETGGGGPQKNDITNAYFHTRVDPATGDRWVFVAAETRSINGDSHVDFEFNQAGVVQTGSDSGELIGMGPDGGRTINDFLITIDFENGGEFPVAHVRFWNGTEFEEVSVPFAVFSSTNLVDISHGSQGTWKHFDDDGAEVDVLTNLQLVEGAANLTALGIEIDPCRTDSTFMVKTRSSASWTADLKDYAIVQFPLEPVPELVLTSPDSTCGGETLQVSATESTGLANAVYTWELTGCGTIVGDPTATTITVQADAQCNCEIGLTASVTGGECGNFTSAGTSVIVRDDVIPTLSDQPEDVTAECDAIPGAAELTATDNCSEATVQLNEVEEPGACVGDATITRTWTGSDACSNDAVHSQVVTVQDTTAPTLSGVPASETVSCDAIPAAAEVTTSDNCSQATVELVETTDPGQCVGDSTLTRTWTGTDECGNATTESQVLTIVDDAAPELAGVPESVTVECDAVPEAATVSASDNCSNALVELAETEEPGQCSGESTISRTWTGTDECGNQSTGSQIVTVADTTAPVMSGLPTDMTVECDALPEPATVTATDNCTEATVEYTEEITGGEGAGKALITRTWTATDDCGNQSTHTQRITVIDTTAPVLAGVPGNATAECDSVPGPAEVTATDNCADPSIDFTETVEPGECNGTSTITRTWTAVDDCGNEVTQTQVITVVDTTLPVLAGVPLDVTAECDAVPLAADVTASDNCSNPDVAFEEIAEPGECQGQSTITRTWTATDECGNVISASQVISVVDTTDPTLSDDPADITVECDSVPEPVTLTADDNCDPDVAVDFAEQSTPGSCPGNYTLGRTWTATDACGNSADVQRTVTVQDTTPPEITPGGSDSQFICDGVPVDFRTNVSDNCGAAAIGLIGLTAITANNRVEVIATAHPDGSYNVAATGPAYVTGSYTAADDCDNVAADFEFVYTASLGREACSQGFWKNRTEVWGPSGYSTDDLFVEAFEITDFSSPELPADFNMNLTLLEAFFTSYNGDVRQTLLHGTGALLNAAHPDVDFPSTVTYVKMVMQAAFAGDITFAEANAVYFVWNSAERECGCNAQ